MQHLRRSPQPEAGAPFPSDADGRSAGIASHSCDVMVVPKEVGLPLVLWGLGLRCSDENGCKKLWR
jgi:hypothetical protein